MTNLIYWQFKENSFLSYFLILLFTFASSISYAQSPDYPIYRSKEEVHKLLEDRLSKITYKKRYKEVEKVIEKEVKSYLRAQKSAFKKEPEAYGERILGEYHYISYYFKKNYPEALYWFTRAVKNKEEGSHGWAAINLADIYYFGYGTTIDYEKAYKYYQIAYDRFSTFRFYKKQAQTAEIVGHMLLKGQGCSQDTLKGIDMLEERIKIYKMDSYSYKWGINPYSTLGDVYYQGIGVKKNIEKAKDYYTEGRSLPQLLIVAELENDYDRYLDIIYDRYERKLKDSPWFIVNNMDDHKDKFQHYYYTKAKAYGRVLDDIGFRHERYGSSWRETLSLYGKSAETGYLPGQSYYGKYLLNYSSTNSDSLSKGLQILEQVALKDSVDAIWLANKYNDPDFLFHSKLKAFKYYKISADAGNEESHYPLALCYLRGEGVDSNKSLAYKYASMTVGAYWNMGKFRPNQWKDGFDGKSDTHQQVDNALYIALKLCPFSSSCRSGSRSQLEKRYEEETTCGVCMGKGTVLCPECKGNGQVDYGYALQSDCARCKGKGNLKCATKVQIVSADIMDFFSE